MVLFHFTPAHAQNLLLTLSTLTMIKKAAEALGAATAIGGDGVDAVRSLLVRQPRLKMTSHLAVEHTTDKVLFQQPEATELGDCPICMIPLPTNDEEDIVMYNCCSTIVCGGCNYAHQVVTPWSLRSCPFCRKLMPETEEGCYQLRMKRVEMNDPMALFQEGQIRRLREEFLVGFELLTKAAALGSAGAHLSLADMYQYGEGVDKDEGKKVYHLEQAAIRGHPHARYKLACEEANNRGNFDRAVRHLIIAAKQGENNSMTALIFIFKRKKKLVSKDDLAETLRAHKAAVDAVKSEQREVFLQVTGSQKEGF